MKFAKELEEDLVPEWRIKYFDYKAGKKKIKALQRAIQNAHKSPRTPLRRTITPKNPIRDFLQPSPSKSNRAADNGPIQATKAASTPEAGQLGEGAGIARRHSTTISSPTRPIPVPQPPHEQYSLTGEYNGDRRVSGSGTVWTRYGSIIASPPSPSAGALSRPATLNLPDPAMDPSSDEDPMNSRGQSNQSNRPIVGSAPNNSQSPFEAGKTRHPSMFSRRLATRHMSLLPLSRTQSSHTRVNDRPLLRSIFSSKQGSIRKAAKYTDVPLEAWKEIESKQGEFFEFLDKQMSKIEVFYKEKEEASTHRLKVLREQLHLMADQRSREINALRQAHHKRGLRHKKHDDDDDADGDEGSSDEGNGIRSIPAQIRNMPHSMDVIYHPIQAAKQVRFGKEPKTSKILATPPDAAQGSAKDYTRKPEVKDIRYIDAKRKLKAALQEYYRSLELLKSYALLNRTAFRKINKKYDKGVHARPTMRYMTETVNKAWFVRSTVIDEHLTATEDLYARYFEKGSHKVAVGKLRKKTRSPGAYNTSVFINGLTAAAGAVFGFEGLVYAADIFYSSEGINEALATRTSYLLQIYAGYFLLLFLVLFFCLDCSIFNRAKVNYVFIFEFDTRHNLDWRQLSELPCFFVLALGLTMWLNFSMIGGPDMYIWWPVVLIGFTVLIMFLPLPILYHESRRWFVYSCWRLLGAGLYPVEFRDFFLGDMFCSQTYSLGGIELFFCIYANSWNNPQQCIMRFLQCLRRYKDTRNIFPHLVNAGKYTFTILQYASLSAFRLSSTTEMRAFFITVATINGLYTSIWDLVMDWSLMDPYAKHRFLRPNLAYKSPYVYYAAMIIDPILRFNWIFYAIPFFTDEIQHSALLGFLVSFSEVIRRGIWTLFRVENEHCTNVGRFRAHRDIPLPYKLPSQDADDYLRSPRDKNPSLETKQSSGPNGGGDIDVNAAGTPTTPGTTTDPNSLTLATSRHSDADTSVDRQPAQASGADLERATTNETAVSSLRRRQQQLQQGTSPALQSSSQSIRARVGTLLRGAHAQDFERRRKDDDVAHLGAESEDDDDDEDSDGVAAEGSDEEDQDDMAATAAAEVAAERDHRRAGASEGAGGGGGPSGWSRASGAMAVADAEERVERREDREDSQRNRMDIQDAEMWLSRARSGE